MSDQHEFRAGDWVQVYDRWHGEEVAGRMLSRRGSEWQVAWIGLDGTEYSMSFTDDCVRPLSLMPPLPAPVAIPAAAVAVVSEPAAAPPVAPAVTDVTEELLAEQTAAQALSPSGIITAAPPRRKKG